MIDLSISGGAGGEAEDVRRCLNVLLGTRVGTVALDRDFGLSWDWLDLPAEAAKAKISTELLKKIGQYEQRVKVSRVTFSATAAGALRPRVEVKIK